MPDLAADTIPLSADAAGEGEGDAEAAGEGEGLETGFAVDTDEAVAEGLGVGVLFTGAAVLSVLMKGLVPRTTITFPLPDAAESTPELPLLALSGSGISSVATGADVDDGLVVATGISGSESSAVTN